MGRGSGATLSGSPITYSGTFCLSNRALRDWNAAVAHGPPNAGLSCIKPQERTDIGCLLTICCSYAGWMGPARLGVVLRYEVRTFSTVSTGV